MELGMNSTFSTVSVRSWDTRSRMGPIPCANTCVPPRPFTARGGVGVSEMKSERTGDMWQVAPVSNMNGIM